MSTAVPFPLPLDHTLRFNEVNSSDILDNETILIAESPTEARGQLPIWIELKQKESKKLLRIEYDHNQENIIIKKYGDADVTLSLTDDKSLANLLDYERILFDISGLPHNVWAPILKCINNKKIKTRVIYAEPEKYKLHPSPASSTQFDLTISFKGLAPLPGFARLTGPEDEDKCLFVAMLGFEGNRPERLVFQIDPAPKILPIVGMPGFKLEYPEFTVACNREFLNDNNAYREIRYARASCPFSAYQTLFEIHQDYPDHYMYIAPVGTKPHALGAIWYTINNPTYTEIMFDHPIKKTGRTKGIGTVHIYDFEKFNDL